MKPILMIIVFAGYCELLAMESDENVDKGVTFGQIKKIGEDICTELLMQRKLGKRCLKQEVHHSLDSILEKLKAGVDDLDLLEELLQKYLKKYTVLLPKIEKHNNRMNAYYGQLVKKAKSSESSPDFPKDPYWINPCTFYDASIQTIETWEDSLNHYNKVWQLLKDTSLSLSEPNSPRYGMEGGRTVQSHREHSTSRQTIKKSSNGLEVEPISSKANSPVLHNSAPAVFFMQSPLDEQQMPPCNPTTSPREPGPLLVSIEARDQSEGPNPYSEQALKVSGPKGSVTVVPEVSEQRSGEQSGTPRAIKLFLGVLSRSASPSPRRGGGGRTTPLSSGRSKGK